MIQGAPVRLEFHAGGHGQPRRQVEWDGRFLWFREAAEGDLHRHPWRAFGPPPEAAWQDLERTLEAVDFWRWPVDPAPGLRAEGGWRLAVRWGARGRQALGEQVPAASLVRVECVLRGLFSEPGPGLPEPFLLCCTEADLEEHFGWDGRHLAFAAFAPRPRLLEGVPVPAVAWAPVLPLLQEARTGQAAATGAWVLAPLGPGGGAGHPVPEGLRPSLRNALRSLLPA